MAWQSRMAAGIALAIVAAGCSSSDDSSGGSAGGGSANKVTASASLFFSPQSISIATGDSVSWVFQSVGHNVTFDAVAGVPASILGSNANTLITRTFTTAGTFTYHCTIHPQMTGTVVVGASGLVDPPPPPPAPPPSNPYGYVHAPSGG